MKSKNRGVNRRAFLKGAVAGAATLATPAESLLARPVTPQPSAHVKALMTPLIESDPPANVDVLTEGRSGSDFMVDVLKSLGIEYAPSVAGSSFRGLHESIINYGGNKNPEFITCCHEESAVAMSHGYAKIEGKPLCVFAHGTVGLQHAAMAIYNAYCDRVPVYVVIGNNLDATKRDPDYGEWYHSVQDAASMVRDYEKWDDTPVSLQHFAESAVRAYKVAMTPPMGPVVLVADSELQERPIAASERLSIPKLVLPTAPQGDSGAVAETAKLLVNAANPVIIVDRTARSQEGVNRLVELAETLQAPVIDKLGRMNFPSRHPLNQTARAGALIAEADVVLGLEVADFWSAVNAFHDQVERSSRPITKPGARLITITADDLYIKSNYQDFRRLAPVDIAIAADAQETLPSLIEAVKRAITTDRKAAFEMRRGQMEKSHAKIMEDARTAATYAWDATPISTARMAMEIYAQIKNEDWSLPSYIRHSGYWPLRLWNFDKHYQFMGAQGGGGVGYNAPATVGAALANKKYGRLTVNIQDDGDLLFAPAVLWTAAHHNIPMLTVMHNNRAYHEELMHVQRMANRRNRGVDNATIGTRFDNPHIDFASIARGFGLHGEGPITDPKDLAPAIKRALEAVKSGEPALVDVVTQPR